MALSTKEEPRRLAPLAESETNCEPVVFVVEVDFRIRHLICTLLRRATTAAVIEAANPYAALSTARNFAGRIDLLISDVNLSASLNGVDLARALTTRTPSMKVLLISAAERPQCEIPQTWRFLAKPFTMESFLECVRALSDSASWHKT
jgi:DNA-binding NtrC family response regulator